MVITMKIKVLNSFRDKTTKKLLIREVDSELKVTDERGKELIELGFVEEVIEEVAEENREDISKDNAAN